MHIFRSIRWSRNLNYAVFRNEYIRDQNDSSEKSSKNAKKKKGFFQHDVKTLVSCMNITPENIHQYSMV